MVKVYMQVSQDRFQLPLAVASSAQELSKITGKSKDTIYHAVWRWKMGRIQKPSFITVDIEEE